MTDADMTRPEPDNHPKDPQHTPAVEPTQAGEAVRQATESKATTMLPRSIRQAARWPTPTWIEESPSIRTRLDQIEPYLASNSCLAASLWKASSQGPARTWRLAMPARKPGPSGKTGRTRRDRRPALIKALTIADSA